jgi:hypothetical protein
VTSNTKYVEAPATAPYVIDSFPAGLSVTVTPVARVSPRGKLRVEVLGTLVGRFVSERKPAAVCPATVSVP